MELCEAPCMKLREHWKAPLDELLGKHPSIELCKASGIFMKFHLGILYAYISKRKLHGVFKKPPNNDIFIDT